MGVSLRHFHRKTKMVAAFKCFVALIGCKYIQLHPEEFWFVPLVNAPWNWKRNREVPHECAFAVGPAI